MAEDSGFYTVYKIVCKHPDYSLMVYVGATTQRIGKRWETHKFTSRNTHLGRAVAEFGHKWFRFEIIWQGNCTRIQLATREIQAIKSEKCLWPNGFNTTPGGDYIVDKPTLIRLLAKMNVSNPKLLSPTQPPNTLVFGGIVDKPNKRESVFGSAPTRIVDDDKRLLFPPSRRTNREGPMKKFRGKWDQPSKWGPQDIVCYYRWLYHTRYGIMPVVDWPMCCGTARTLLKRLGTPKSVKRYLQLSFALMRFKPQGLNSLYHSTLYEQVREHWEADEDLYDDYVDDYVFPWCKELVSQESSRVMQDYTRKQVLAAFSPRHLAMVEKQRKEKRMKLMLQSMKDNWHLYSQYRRK